MPPIRHLLSIAAVTALVSGCAAVGPDYARPASPSHAAFRNTPPPTAARTVDLATWWTGFDDPLLDRIVARALAQNLDLAQAAARVEQARAATGAARAALLPSGDLAASAGGGLQSARTPIGRINDQFGGDRFGTAYDAGLGVGWDADLFGGLRRGSEAARADYQAAGADAVAARIGVVAEAADTYLLVRTVQARIGVLREQIAMQRRLVGIIRLQVSRGIAADLRLSQTEGALASVEAAVPPLENGLEVAMNALDVLTGAQPGAGHAELARVVAIPVPPAIGTAGGPADLLRRRPDIIAAERRLAASNARIGGAIAEYYPKLSLSGLLGLASTGATSLLGTGALQAQGVAGVRWRLFDFGRVDAEVAGARGRNAEALAAFRLSVLRATQDVENAFDALARRGQQAALLATAEAALVRARRSSFAAYQGGVVSLLEVLDADDRLLRTREARVLAQSEAARAAVASFRALGGGWQS